LIDKYHSFILFKQRKYKTFSYKPRFSKDNEILGEEVNQHVDFASKWRRLNEGKTKQVKGIFSLRFLILALVLLLICMYFLENKYM